MHRYFNYCPISVSNPPLHPNFAGPPDLGDAQFHPRISGTQIYISVLWENTVTDSLNITDIVNPQRQIRQQTVQMYLRWLSLNFERILEKNGRSGWVTACSRPGPRQNRPGTNPRVQPNGRSCYLTPSITSTFFFLSFRASIATL